MPSAEPSAEPRDGLIVRLLVTVGTVASYPIGITFACGYFAVLVLRARERDRAMRHGFAV